MSFFWVRFLHGAWILCATVAKVAGDNCPFQVPTPNFTMAVTSDMGMYRLAEVVRFIADQKPDILVIPGDLGYDENYVTTPFRFMRTINGILDPSLPVFFTKGNHDENTNHWAQETGYADLLALRWQNAGTNYTTYGCAGIPGVNQSCAREGLFFTLATHGCQDCWFNRTGCDDTCQAQPGFHEHFLQGTPGLWRICFWHKNMNKLQVGGKPDETGYGPYEECRKAGAIIVNGHEHSYQRTRTLSSMSNQTVDADWPFPDRLRVKEGSSFVLNAALGGMSVRDQQRCLEGERGWEFPYGCKQEWGRILTATQPEMAGVVAAVTFFHFNVDGNPCKGRGRLLTPNGTLLDEFVFYSQVQGSEMCCPDIPEPISESPPELISEAPDSTAGSSVGRSPLHWPAAQILLFLLLQVFSI